MIVQYAGVDISDKVSVAGAKIIDSAGGCMDRVEMEITDEAQTWLGWDVQKNDTLRIRQAGYDTGTVYIDEIRNKPGEFGFGAVSAPPIVRQSNSRAWESVRLFDLLVEFAARTGLSMQMFGMEEDPLYARIEQKDTPDIAWLQQLCMREGCTVKIADGTFNVIYEPWMERRKPTFELALDGATDYSGLSTSIGIYAGCRVLSKYEGSYGIEGATGPWLIVNAAEHGIQVGSSGEAQRFARGILRANNKREHLLHVNNRPLNLEIAGGSIIKITAAGKAWSGNWIVDRVCHDLHKERTHVQLRKPLEGY